MELSGKTPFIAWMGLDPKGLVPLSQADPRVIAQLDVPELWSGSARSSCTEGQGMFPWVVRDLIWLCQGYSILAATINSGYLGWPAFLGSSVAAWAECKQGKSSSRNALSQGRQHRNNRGVAWGVSAARVVPARADVCRCRGLV